MGTEDRIVAKALEMFNQKGIEYVGMRELAAALDTKLGNITYYFPTKEDLILRLAMDLSELNSKVMQPDHTITMTSYMEMFKAQFENQYQYRCIFLSFVHLIAQYEKMTARYKKVEDQRKKTTLLNIRHLTINKYLKELSDEDLDFLKSSIMLISRFWISESAVSHNHLKPDDQIGHYLKLIGNNMSFFCTTKGKLQLNKFITSL